MAFFEDQTRAGQPSMKFLVYCSDFSPPTKLWCRYEGEQGV